MNDNDSRGFKLKQIEEPEQIEAKIKTTPTTLYVYHLMHTLPFPQTTANTFHIKKPPSSIHP